MPSPTSDRRATERKHPWPMVRLGDVCEVQRGGSPRPIKDYITDSTEGLNWIKIGDVEPAGKYITQTVEKIKASGLNKTRKVSAGDFLLSNSMSFGRPYILKIDGCIHDGWLVLKGFSKTFTEDFFYYLLRSPIVQEQFDKLAHGSTVRNLNTDVVSRVSLPLPPLSIQREVVARLERELAAVEKMNKGFETLAETSKAGFKAELKEVFEEISRGGAYPPAEGCPRSGCPSRGETRRLGEIGRVAMCKRVLKAQTSENGDVPFFKIGTFGKEPNAYISNELFREFVKKFSYPKKGDVLISAAGTIGRTIVFDGKPSYFQDSNIVWLEHDGTKVTNEYLHCFYWSKPWKVSDGATIPRIYNGDIESVEIPLPSLPVQRQIVARLDSAKARAEKLEAKAREGVAVCETMRKAILKEAFE